MKADSTFLALSTLCLFVTAAHAAPFAGPVFYGDAPDEHHAWAIHDANRPQPKIITPGTFSSQEQPGKPPSDAIILFDGTDLSKWEADSGENVPTKWVINNGAMECVPGSGFIRTKEKIGDCQLHVEWAAPTKAEGDSQGRGNSGVFLMGEVEVQVLDNYNNPTYADGMAGAVYGQHAPMANALRPPGQFQVYDIVFRRPIYKDGKEVEPGYVTVFENGVVVEDHAELEGGTGHMARAKPHFLGDAGPLKLQDHGNPVRYRNIWYRPLPPRSVEGGVDGYLTVAATMAKRKELAADIRKDADQISDTDGPRKMLRVAESLVYEPDSGATQLLEQMLSQYVAGLKQLPADKLGAKKDEAKHVRDALNYLIRFKDLAPNFPPKAELDEFIKAQNWDKK